MEHALTTAFGDRVGLKRKQLLALRRRPRNSFAFTGKVIEAVSLVCQEYGLVASTYSEQREHGSALVFHVIGTEPDLGPAWIADAIRGRFFNRLEVRHVRSELRREGEPWPGLVTRYILRDQPLERFFWMHEFVVPLEHLEGD